MNKNARTIGDLWNAIKWNNLCLMGVSEEETEKEAE